MLSERAFSCVGLLDVTSTQPGVRLTQLRQRALRSDGSHYEKRGKGEPVCIDDEIPFEIPESWVWVRLESLLSDIIVPIRDKPTKLDGPIPWCRIEDIEGRVISRSLSGQGVDQATIARMNLKVYPVNTVLCSNSATIGVPAIVTTPLVTNQRFIGFLPASGFEPVYLFYLFLAFNKTLTTVGTGTTHAYISRGKFEQLIVPLPPTSEQVRIYQAIDTLDPLVDDYGALEDSRERLDAELPNRLRKSIQQLAVQGRLVEQDPADEPASALLDRIRAERAALVKAKKVRAPKGGESIIYRASDGGYYEKRGKGEPVCIDDEIPFDIPESWEWVRLESVTIYIQRGKSPKYSPINKYPVVAQKCNQWSGFSLELAKFVDPSTVNSYTEERILQDGDLLWNSTGLGTLGRMAIYDSSVNEYGWAVADSHVTVIRTVDDWLDHRYAFAYFAGPSVQSVIEDKASGSTKQKELAQETVRNYLVPIPPRCEQARIAEQLRKALPQLTNQ